MCEQQNFASDQIVPDKNLEMQQLLGVEQKRKKV